MAVVQSDLVAVLNHRTRRDILRLMSDGRPDLGPKEVGGLLDCDVPTIAYHFTVLRDVEAINLVRTEPARGSRAHFYRVAPDLEALDWVWELLAGEEED